MFSVPELRAQIWKGARIVLRRDKRILKSSFKNRINLIAITFKLKTEEIRF